MCILRHTFAAPRESPARNEYKSSLFASLRVGHEAKLSAEIRGDTILSECSRWWRYRSDSTKCAIPLILGCLNELFNRIIGADSSSEFADFIKNLLCIENTRLYLVFRFELKINVLF